MAFILGDLASSRVSLFTSDNTTIVEVAGQKISYDDYLNHVNQQIKSYEAYTGKAAEGEMESYLRDQAWDRMIRETILDQQFSEAGVAVSPEEVFDMVQGKNIHPEVKRAFSNPQTGEFNAAQVVMQMKSQKDNEQFQTWWNSFERDIIRDRYYDKYTTLIKKGLYTTTAEAQRSAEENSAKVTMVYVQKAFKSIPDSTIQVTDADISAYYNAHKEEYRQKEEERTIEYVVFDVNPSHADTAEVEEWIGQMKTELAASEDDSLFVNRNADTPFDAEYHSKGTIAANLDSVFFSADKGTIVGPYFENGSYKLAKLMDRRMRPDSAQLRTILILAKQPGDTLAAHNKADSLVQVLKGGADFKTVAFQNSDDQTNKADSGNIGWVSEYDQKVQYYGQQFADTCFAVGSKGLIVLKMPFGAIIADVQAQTPAVPQVQIAFVDRRVVPGTETFNDIYAKANAFAGTSRTPEAFQANSNTLSKRVAENLHAGDRNVTGLESARELIRWIFNNNEGDISDVMSFGDKFVVAYVKQVFERGYIPIEKKKLELELLAKKEKKAEQLMADFNKVTGGNADIQSVAVALQETAKPVDNFSFGASFVTGLGMEPAVIGTAFALQPNQLSKPIKGNSGVYVITVQSATPAEAQTDLTGTKASLSSNLQSRVNGEVLGALIDQADVHDHRTKFQ